MKTCASSSSKSAAIAGAVLALFCVSAQAEVWSDTEVQYLHGSKYREPFNPNDVTKDILTLQHAGGFAYGRNFFFVDFLKSNDKDNNAGEIYGEWYTSFSLSKLSGTKMEGGPLRDVNLTFGINYGAKNTGPNPRVFLPGVTVDLNVPGFAFFNVDLLAYIDNGNFKPNAATNVANCGGHKTSYQITPAWKLPFSIGASKWSFEGFLDYIGSRGTCKTEVLTQPQLRLDVGNFWGKPETVFAGIEYQYWNNKFGVKDLKEHHPQLLLVWKF
jgi:nucleoside-specific outer membrane channel protein Tsx